MPQKIYCQKNLLIMLYSDYICIMNDETWRDIKGYEGLYQVSNYGRVKSLIKGIILKPKVCKTGYLCVGLWKDGKQKWMLIHRLVTQTFIPNPVNKPQVNHIDGVKSNNVVYNLEWVTSSENNQHAVNTGLSKLVGEDNHQSKLTNDDVTKIKKLKGVYSQRELARMFGVSKGAIHFIHHDVNWKKHEENYA